MRIEEVDLNGNTEHATRHGVSADEIIQLFTNKPRISLQPTSARRRLQRVRSH